MSSEHCKQEVYSVKVVVLPEFFFGDIDLAAIGEGEVSDDGERRHGGKGEERRVRIGQAQNTLWRFATERKTKENEQNRAFRSSEQTPDLETGRIAKES